MAGNDTKQYIGRAGEEEAIITYKAGPSKLLARRNIKEASINNDNYAYWAMSRWMEKKTGVYPQYPAPWDLFKSKKENEDRELSQPGTPKAPTWDIEDSSTDESTAVEVVSDALYSADTYPDWYKPVLDAMDSGNITSPVIPPPVNDPVPKDANPDTIVCETTDKSPLFMDCVHAFSSDDLRGDPAHHGKKGEGYWQGVSDSP
ncbi:hypothetical protein F4819DRAFT_448117 [Hypoxylon fuscum]|nr:hypothetical protein F4819DRAFT_448117 [Hypoxylon fuscum]